MNVDYSEVQRRRLDRAIRKYRTQRRVTVVLCVLFLFVLAYALIRDPLLSLAATWVTGAPIVDWGMA